MYRLGCFNSSAFRPDPILVRLRTVWDKRFILNSCQKLKLYEERVFIAPDEPVKQRRKSMLERHAPMHAIYGPTSYRPIRALDVLSAVGASRPALRRLHAQLVVVECCRPV
jgi:hypothetical protein